MDLEKNAQLRGFGLGVGVLVLFALLAVAGPFLAVHLLSDGQLAATIEEGGVSAVALLCLLQLVAGGLMGIVHLRRPLPLVVHAVVPAAVALTGVWAAHGSTYDGIQALSSAAAGDKLRLWALAQSVGGFPARFAMLAVGPAGLYLAAVGAMTLLVRRGQGGRPRGFPLVPLAGVGVLVVGLVAVLVPVSGIGELHDSAVFAWLAGVVLVSAGLLVLGGVLAQPLLQAGDPDVAGAAQAGLLLCGLGAAAAALCQGLGIAGFYQDTLYRCGAELSRQHAMDVAGCVDRAVELGRLAGIAAWVAPLLVLAATLHFAFWQPAALAALRRRILGTALLVPLLVVAAGAGWMIDSGLQADAAKVSGMLFEGRGQDPPPGVTLPASGYGYLDPWSSGDRVVLGRVGERTMLLGDPMTDVEDLLHFKVLQQKLEERPRPSAPFRYQGPYLAAHGGAPVEPVLETAALVEILGRCELHLLVQGGQIRDRVDLDGQAGQFVDGLDRLPRYLPLGLARGFQLCGGGAPPRAEQVAIRIEPETLRVLVAGEPRLVLDRSDGMAFTMLGAKLPELAGDLSRAGDVFIQPAGPMTLDELVSLLTALQTMGLVRAKRPVAEKRERRGGELAERVAVLSLDPDFRVPRWEALAQKAGIKLKRHKVSHRKGRGGRKHRGRGARIGAGAGAISGGGGGRGQAAINRVIAIAGRKIQKCYDRLLEEQPGAGGRVGVKLSIAPDGSVSSCELTQNTVGDAGLGSCAVNAVRALTFPAADRTSNVTHTFQFEDLTRR